MEQTACDKKRKFVISIFKHQNIIHDKLTTVAVHTCYLSNLPGLGDSPVIVPCGNTTDVGSGIVSS